MRLRLSSLPTLLTPTGALGFIQANKQQATVRLKTSATADVDGHFLVFKEKVTIQDLTPYFPYFVGAR